MKRPDVIVLGLGAMGSAALWQLAKRGLKVLGLEQYEIGHLRGSSHGESRLIRKAYWEHPSYVPLLERSYELWRELERDTGKSLLHLRGLVIYGPQSGGTILPGVRVSVEKHGLSVQALGEQEAKAAYPGYAPPPGYIGILEPGAGYLDVEDCVKAQAEAALAAGAEIQAQCEVLSVDEKPGGVLVKTRKGTFEADQLVIAAGAWNPRWLPRVAPKLKVHRVSLFWFRPGKETAPGSALPCFGFDLPEGFFYGLPALGPRGLKVGLHLPGEVVADPKAVDRSTRPEDVLPVRRFVEQCLPGVDPHPIEHAVCMYTMTPDEHFVVDREGRVSYAAGFSGHGFKFATVMGEVLAELATTGKSRHPVDFLRYRW